MNKQRGAEDVTLDEAGAEGSLQASTEDGVYKTGEMRLQKFPKALADQRKKQKESRVEAGLKARAEEIDGAKSDAEKILYDHYRKEGLDNQQAMQIARAQAGRAAKQASDDPRHGLTVRDQRGEHAY